MSIFNAVVPLGLFPGVSRSGEKRASGERFGGSLRHQHPEGDRANPGCSWAFAGDDLAERLVTDGMTGAGKATRIQHSLGPACQEGGGAPSAPHRRVDRGSGASLRSRPHLPGSAIPRRSNASSSNTRGGSQVRWRRSLGSVRGALGTPCLPGWGRRLQTGAPPLDSSVALAKRVVLDRLKSGRPNQGGWPRRSRAADRARLPQDVPAIVLPRRGTRPLDGPQVRAGFAAIRCDRGARCHAAPASDPTSAAARAASSARTAAGSCRRAFTRG